MHESYFAASCTRAEKDTGRVQLLAIVVCGRKYTYGPRRCNIGSRNGNRYRIYLHRSIFNRPPRFSERNPLIKLLTSLRDSTLLTISLGSSLLFLSIPFVSILRRPKGPLAMKIREIRHQTVRLYLLTLLLLRCLFLFSDLTIICKVYLIMY